MHASSLRAAPGLAVALLVCGCYEAREAPRVEGRDAGGIVATDASVRPDAAAPRDAGAMMCTSPLGPYEGERCRPDTFDCLSACGEDPDCGEACYAADPSCVRCFNHALATCANRARCEARWSRFACCVRASGECPGLSGVDLFGCGVCLAELDDYATCANSVLDALGPECDAELVDTCVP